MRAPSLAVCVSTILLVAGAVAAGCVSSNGNGPADDGGLTFDAGSFDAAPPPVDAATDTSSLDASTPDAAPVDFGLVPCGSGPASHTYSLANPTSQSITYSASVPSGSAFSITSGASGTVAPSATGSITLAVSVPSTATAGTPMSSTLTVTTNVPGASTVNVPLSVTPQGGAITVSPAPVAFGQAQLAYGAVPIPLTITNTGNAPVTVTFGAPTESDGGIDPAFGLAYAGSGADASVTIPAGGSLADAGATFVPTAPGADSVTFAVETSGALCGTSATDVAMNGTGTTAQVTVGPSPLQFGLVPCGDAGAPLQVTVMNSSPGAVGFTASLGLGAASPFVIDLADGGTVPGLGSDGGPGTTVITVTPKPIPVPASIDGGAFDDTLLVTPSAPFVSATPIALQESAEGAILTVTVPDGGAFGSVQAPLGAMTVTVVNTGNMPAVVSVNPVTGVTDAGTFFGNQVTAPPDGSSTPLALEYQPAANGPAGTNFTVTSSAPLCSPPPAPIPVTATGLIAVASFSATPMALSSTCGAGAGAPVSLTITNTGQGNLQIQSAQSVSGEFTITSPLPITIPQDGEGTITLTPVAVGQGTAAGTVLSDTLQFFAGEVSTQVEPRTVAVQLTLSGANLSYQGLTGNALDVTTCGGSYTVQNTGDQAATVLGTGSYPTDSPFTFGDTFSATGTPVVAAGGTQSDNVSANLCQATLPCSLSAIAPQAFDSSPPDGGASAAGICIPLPPLTVTLNLPDVTESCQQQCCD